MNAALVKLALEKVPSPNVLINMVSQRVRQLNSGRSRPMLLDVVNLSMADIALREILEGKMEFEMPDIAPLVRPTARHRKRPQHWARSE
jgi:DNA-directed RNA polymerase subunit omega